MTVDPCQGRVLISCVRDEGEKSMESKYVPVTSSLRKLDDSRHSLGGRRRRGAGDMGANPIVAIICSSGVMAGALVLGTSSS